VTVERNGRMIVLSDGTAWAVETSHSRATAFWRPGVRVVVGHSADDRHPLTLTNLDSPAFDVVLATRL